MTEQQGGDRRAVGREEFALLKQMFTERFNAHEELDKTRFEAMEKVANERHNALTIRLENVAKAGHELRDSLVEVFVLPARVAELVRELDGVPRKLDLEYVSKTFTTEIAGLKESIKEERVASEKRISRMISIVGLVLVALQILMKFWKP